VELVSRISASWNPVTTLLLWIQSWATGWVDRVEALGSVSCLNAGSFARAAAFNVCRRSAKGDIVPSGGLHDSPDRVHNDLWLVDRHDVTGFFRDDQTSSV
jgi:hypothetical protein